MKKGNFWWKRRAHHRKACRSRFSDFLTGFRCFSLNCTVCRSRVCLGVFQHFDRRFVAKGSRIFERKQRKGVCVFSVNRWKRDFASLLGCVRRMHRVFFSQNDRFRTFPSSPRTKRKKRPILGKTHKPCNIVGVFDENLNKRQAFDTRKIPIFSPRTKRSKKHKNHVKKTT